MDPKQDGLATPPAKLMQSFISSRFLLWIGVALVAHVIFIGGCSVGYIRDTWIDPEGAILRKAEAEAAAKAAQAQAVAQAAPVPAAVATTNAVAAVTNSAEAAGDALMEERKDTPMIKAITEKPKAGELPPDDLGISIHDTNVK